MSTGKRRRWPWFVAAVVVVLLLVAALAIPALLRPERFRSRIEAALESATGWRAELGELDFSIARGMVLTVSPGTLSAPGDSSRFRIETLAIKADLWPLLHGQLDIQRIDLIGPDILLVREDEASGWALPLPAGDDATGGEGEAAGGLEVSIERLQVEGGRLVLDDRVAPGLRFELQDVGLTLDVATLTVSGQATLDDDGGRLRWNGPLEEAITLTLDGLRTERLHPWLGADLLHAGGRLSGTVVVDWPESIRGDLNGTAITLLAGERPFETVATTFDISFPDGGVRLDRLDLDAAGARLTGSGSLSPDLAVDLVLPETPLDVTLRAAESAVPLPLDLRPPGKVNARFDVDMPAGGTLTYAASGSVTAEEFHAGETLPVAQGIQADFVLDRKGVLEVRVLQGTVGGGKVSGTARVDPVYPPGKLSFDGGLRDALLGHLLDGYVKNAASEVGGLALVSGRVGLNLSGELDARALGGQVDLSATRVSLPGWDLEGAVLAKLQEKLGAVSNLAALFDKNLAGKLEGSAAAPATPRATELLESLGARVDFDSWPWRLEGLKLAAGDLSASGAGTFDPLAGRVSLDFTSRLSAEFTAELVARNPQLKPLIGPQGQLVLPLHIEGPLLAPSIGVDLEAIALEALGADSAKDALKGALKGLFDRNRPKPKPDERQDPLLD